MSLLATKPTGEVHILAQALFQWELHLPLCWVGIDLKKASKSFAQHFSCGSSVTGEDEIVIQGDVSYDVINFIQEKWPEVSTMLCGY